MTSLETMVAVVVDADGFARIWISSLQPANSCPGGGESAVTVTDAPASYAPSPLPSFTVRVGPCAAVVAVRAPALLDETAAMAIFAPGTGLLSGYTEGSFAAVLVQEENCRLPMCRNIEAVALLR